MVRLLCKDFLQGGCELMYFILRGMPWADSQQEFSVILSGIFQLDRNNEAPLLYSKETSFVLGRGLRAKEF